MSEDKDRERAQALAVFEQHVGTWDAESVINPGPGAPPIHQKGVSENHLIANGSWLITEYSAESGTTRSGSTSALGSIR
jgi:hypothetical protein